MPLTDAEKSRRYREKHRDKSLAATRKYREANKDKVQNREREYRETHKEQIKNRHATYRRNNAEAVAFLCARANLARSMHTAAADVPQELVEAKLINLKLKRALKESAK